MPYAEVCDGILLRSAEAAYVQSDGSCFTIGESSSRSFKYCFGQQIAGRLPWFAFGCWSVAD
jgi:hypothetical protein